jgi:hypothetical protein
MGCDIFTANISHNKTALDLPTTDRFSDLPLLLHSPAAPALSLRHRQSPLATHCHVMWQLSARSRGVHCRDSARPFGATIEKQRLHSIHALV